MRVTVNNCSMTRALCLWDGWEETRSLVLRSPCYKEGAKFAHQGNTGLQVGSPRSVDSHKILFLGPPPARAANIILRSLRSYIFITLDHKLPEHFLNPPFRRISPSWAAIGKCLEEDKLPGCTRWRHTRQSARSCTMLIFKAFGTF